MKTTIPQFISILATLAIFSCQSPKDMPQAASPVPEHTTSSAEPLPPPNTGKTKAPPKRDEALLDDIANKPDDVMAQIKSDPASIATWGEEAQIALIEARALQMVDEKFLPHLHVAALKALAKKRTQSLLLRLTDPSQREMMKTKLGDTWLDVIFENQLEDALKNLSADNLKNAYEALGIDRIFKLKKDTLESFAGSNKAKSLATYLGEENILKLEQQVPGIQRLAKRSELSSMFKEAFAFL